MAAPGKLSAPDVQMKISDLYRSGSAIKEIAKQIGVSYMAVHGFLSREKLLVRAADFPVLRFGRMFAVTPGCWLWSGYLSPDGYGAFSVKDKLIGAHRFSYMTYKGEIPDGMFVLHSCDNPRCVNPEHLRVGTAADNAQDKISRNRSNSLRGEAHQNSKLSDCDVLAIRSDARNLKVIALDYGVSRQTIGRVRNRTTWSHI